MGPIQTTLPEEIVKEIENFGLQVERLKKKEIPEEKFKRFRLQHGIYGQRQKGFQMVRVKIPSGVLNSRKLRALAEIAEHYSTGKGHVTTRQDIQYHFVKLDDITAVMTRLAESGLTTREACGNTVRNVTACHLAGVCPTELFDVTAISEKVAYYLLRNPINQDLPRKFKISFSGCQSECGLASIHDIGFIATSRDVQGRTEYGFKVFVGGGLGSHPKLAKLYTEFLPMEEVLPFCEAILKIFDANGDRKTKSKARMKFIIEKWGSDQFNNKVAEELALLKESGKVYPALPAPQPKAPSLELDLVQNGGNGHHGNAAYEKWFRTNIIPQPMPGICAVQIKLILGDITAAQLRGMADIVDRFSPDAIRTTHQQNLILHHVRRQDLPALYAALDRIGLAGAGAERAVDVIACPGADSCQLALTSSMGLGAAIVDRFEKDLPEFEDINGLRIRISGCPNSCGHHHIAGIGFHGVGKKVHGKLAPHYQLHLGGGVSAERSVIGASKLKIPAKNIPSAVIELIKAYRENRQGEEAFNQFIERFGRDALSARLEKFIQIPTPQEAPEYYQDYNGDQDFSLDDLGPGECAGTVIDMIEHHLRMGSQSIEKASAALARGQSDEAIADIKQAIMVCCRALLIPFGVDLPHEDQILKEFQHKLVEQGIVTERFENFTEDLGKWVSFDPQLESVRKTLDLADAFVRECHEAYDRLDAGLKLRKREPISSVIQNEVDMSVQKEVDASLDLSGVACPMNFVKTKLQLEEMDAGQLLEVIIDDGEPIRNVPRSVQAEGHKILKNEKLPDGHFKLVIEKV
ncbi:sulfurtransferase TusA family protein [Candidatus Manganitrophus noduliformans]|uniref:Sulfite reductase n=1 Tax=Candidatus Manganitrophus noduliformans TaxID=2606439 RepID=A0A7X6IB59_9BACT|nr:sulfurtransferase TusA family protein [Candidatus Manganitrophus noduliformans]NKE71441.1 sulfite reductase [Candidatus Manganitrophus noduliformans]